MMKNLIGKALAFGSLAVLLLASCKKEGNIVSIDSSTTKVGTLTASTTTPVLTKATLSATAVTFTSTASNYGYAAAVTYTLQLDTKGDNFATPKKEVVLTGLSQSYTVQDFNNLLLAMKLPVGVAAQLEARVKSSLSATAGVTYSNVVSITATPFALTSWVYVVGNFNGYSTNTPDSLISATGNGIYIGIINFTAAGNRFLVLPAKNYNNKYAISGNPPSGTITGSVTYSTIYVTGGGNDLYAPSAAGNYLITLNTNTNSITVEPTNTYSAIGTTAADAGGYGIDVPLTKYVNDGVNGWTGIVAFRVGDFKIRQNNDWNFSWGVPKAGSEGDGVAGTLNNTSNNNIPITVAGNYAVSFNITPFALGASAPTSVPPTKTATYKLVKQ